MTEVAEVRLLAPGDEARLFELLERHEDTSLFFFSNIAKAGLLDLGEPFQGSYVASFDAAGVMTAVASHQWNGNMLLQGDRGLEQAAVQAAATSGRAVRGFIGPYALTLRARQALGMAEIPANHDERELLLSLALDELKLPEPPSRGELALRPPTLDEAAGTLSAWRAAYMVESLGSLRTAELEASAREQTIGWRESGALWVLVADGELVAMSGFNAQARGIVQVGGVFTPPELRGRGYGRSVVAATLQLARAEGATRSVLFTAEGNMAARRAYVSLGYRVVGDFGLILF
jgi:RimJ/RimL family protein N-acetyltransferase